MINRVIIKQCQNNLVFFYLNLLTDDFFYQGLGKTKQERQLNYQQLLIDKTIQKAYNKDIWGSDAQRYVEKQKINRKMNRKIKVKAKKA